MDFVYLLQQFRNIGMGDDFVTPLQCVLLLVALFPSYFVAPAIMVLLGLGDGGQRTLNQVLIILMYLWIAIHKVLFKKQIIVAL